MSHFQSQTKVVNIIITISISILIMRIIPSIFDIFPTRSNAVAAIDVPNPMDVLCGKDKTFAAHEGNQVYKQRIAAASADYAVALSKQAKMKITKSIVSAMQDDHGSRFLRQTATAGWIEISNVQARDKTSHALRFFNNHKLTKEEEEDAAAFSATHQQQYHHHPRRISNDDTLRSEDLNVLIDEYMHDNNEVGRDVNSSETFMDTLRSEDLNALMNEYVPDNNIGAVFVVDDVAIVDRNMVIEVVEHHHVNNAATRETAFDTLRSEDLRAILDEPMQENEWDDVLTLLADN